jgi:hypothetical protein
MPADALWLDGNALAGLLDELFGAEITTAQRACGSCGGQSAIGAHRLYQGAGAVLRCPACGDVALRVAALGDRHMVQITGTWTLVR